MRVFLGNAPWKKPGFYGVRAGSRWPHFESAEQEYMPFPFFLAYATAVLERAGVEPLLVDACAERLELPAFVERAARFDPALLLLEVSTISIDADLTAARALRERLPQTRLAFAGLHAFMYEPAWLAEHRDVDFVLIGEYETTLAELVQRLGAGAPPAGCAGLLWRDGDRVVGEGRRPLVEDLDSLPWPARHFLPLANYHDEPGSIPRPSAQMWASRGCPFGCVFCAWPQIMYDSRRCRLRSIRDTVDEMEWLVRDGGFRSVYFDDDTFNVKKERTLAFAREVRRRRIGAPWAIMARADLMDRETLAALKDSGLAALKYGVESAEPALLGQMEKALDLDKVRAVLGWTRELGIKMHLTFLFGMAGETRETAQRTIDLALASEAESVQFSIATPFPGSRYHRELAAAGRLVSGDFAKYDGFRSAVVRTDHLEPRDLEEIVGEAQRRWREHREQREQRRHPDPRTPLQKAVDLAKEPQRIPSSLRRLWRGGG
jgi:radical SAM superfamily enzyme YgiQ (UPF0313 family)